METPKLQNSKIRVLCVCVFLKASISQQSLTTLDGLVYGPAWRLRTREMSSEFERFCGNTVRKGKIPKPCSPSGTPPHPGV